MEDDLVTCLTRQVKEDIVENYLAERRLLEIQLEEVATLADATWSLAEETGKRFSRIGFLLVDDEHLARLEKILKIEADSYWAECLHEPFTGGVPFIQVVALTSKSKYRKLVQVSLKRLYEWVDKYQQAYHKLQGEIRAVNLNISNFHSNFDLLTIINFLKNLDVCTLEQRHFLGDNFTPEEVVSIDQKLHIASVTIDRFRLPEPARLPPFGATEASVLRLCTDVYRAHSGRIKRFLR